MVNRGKSSIDEVAAKAMELGTERFLIVDRWKGGPSKIEAYRLKRGRSVTSLATIYLGGLKISKERVRKISQIVADQREGRVREAAEAFSKLFEVPLLFSERGVDIVGCDVTSLHMSSHYDGEDVKAFLPTKIGQEESFIIIKGVVLNREGASEA